MYDVAIVGGGIAGLTAAIYTTRRELSTIVISLIPGGQMSTTPDIENWPGEDKINGAELTSKIQKQAEKFGTEIKSGMVSEIIKTKNNLGLKVGKDKISAKSIILAYGKSPRKLGINNEKELEGKGISYCVNCDGQFFRNKNVAIVGGGNSALEAVITMSRIGKKVYLIHRRNEFRGEKILIENVNKIENVETVLGDEILKIIGEDQLEKIITKTGKELNISGLFVEIGYVANSSIVKKIVEIDNQNLVKVNSYQETSQKGIFAAGDITNQPYQQLVIAAGQGATAGLSVFKYLQSIWLLHNNHKVRSS